MTVIGSGCLFWRSFCIQAAAADSRSQSPSSDRGGKGRQTSQPKGKGKGQPDGAEEKPGRSSKKKAKETQWVVKKPAPDAAVEEETKGASKGKAAGGGERELREVSVDGGEPNSRRNKGRGKKGRDASPAGDRPGRECSADHPRKGRGKKGRDSRESSADNPRKGRGKKGRESSPAGDASSADLPRKGRGKKGGESNLTVDFTLRAASAENQGKRGRDMSLTFDRLLRSSSTDHRSKGRERGRQVSLPAGRGVRRLPRFRVGHGRGSCVRGVRGVALWCSDVRCCFSNLSFVL